MKTLKINFASGRTVVTIKIILVYSCFFGIPILFSLLHIFTHLRLKTGFISTLILAPSCLLFIDYLVTGYVDPFFPVALLSASLISSAVYFASNFLLKLLRKM